MQPRLDSNSLYSWSWSWTDLPASTSQLLRWQACVAQQASVFLIIPFLEDERRVFVVLQSSSSTTTSWAFNLTGPFGDRVKLFLVEQSTENCFGTGLSSRETLYGGSIPTRLGSFLMSSVSGHSGDIQVAKNLEQIGQGPRRKPCTNYCSTTGM